MKKNQCDTGSRPIILTFVHYYLPGYKAGGPVRTIANLVEALGDEFDFRIVTTDRDATETQPYLGLPPSGQWVNVGKAQVLYLSSDRQDLWTIADILRNTLHHTLYLNSFLDPVFTLKPLLVRRLGLAPKTRCVIAPRGEFSRGALALKATKKRGFLIASRALGIYHNLIWQASSEHEADDIKRIMGPVASDIQVAINLPAPPDPQAAQMHRQRTDGEPLRIVFLSRISPMKNLVFALEVLRQVQSPIVLDLYGPIRDVNYWTHCKQLMSQLPGHVKATYRGSVEHNTIPSILNEYDLFFLPTLGENYGHAILEALAAGTPVLIADTTPWRGLEDVGVGWDLSLDKPRLFAEKIELMAHMSSSNHLKMRKRAYCFAQQRYADPSMLVANRRLLVANL